MSLLPSPPTLPARRVQTTRRPRVNPHLLPVLDPHTAGIDIGATSLCVAVTPGRDPEPVRTFRTFTADLHALAAWLQACEVRSVAMEATGVYWLPVYQVLAAAGFAVCLVNPRHVQHVRGRKTDVSDCQWLQLLHSVGLLRGSFRPPETICALRTLFRQREHLIQQAAEQIQLMQKALDQMNLHLHHVLSDLAGVSGLRIIDALLAGERDPEKLVTCRDPRVKTEPATMVAALTGDWRPEHLFTLRQARQTFTHYHTLLHACDAEIETWLQQHPPLPPSELPAAASGPEKPARALRQKRRPRNEPRLETLDLRAELHTRFGVDLTQVPALGLTTVLGLYAELGPSLAAFPSAAHFTSWLALCPNPHKSGGKVLQSHTRDVKHRVAHLLRQAAQSLCRHPGPLGDFYRRLRAKLGGPQAVTATAHKLARIMYQLVTTGQEYDETVFAQEAARQRERRLKQLQRQAKVLGFTLNPVEVS